MARRYQAYGVFLHRITIDCILSKIASLDEAKFSSRHDFVLQKLRCTQAQYRKHWSIVTYRENVSRSPDLHSILLVSRVLARNVSQSNFGLKYCLFVTIKLDSDFHNVLCICVFTATYIIGRIYVVFWSWMNVKLKQTELLDTDCDCLDLFEKNTFILDNLLRCNLEFS